jgi:hypothetical protein
MHLKASIEKLLDLRKLANKRSHILDAEKEG